MRKPKKVEFLFGTTKKKSRFSRTLGGKQFFSSSGRDGYYFAEEMIYKVVERFNPDLLEGKFCSIALVDDKRYVVTFFNDQEDPEDNIEYSLDDFGKSDIENFLENLLVEQEYKAENVIQLSINDEIVLFDNIYDQGSQLLLSEALIDELKIEYVLKAYKRYVKFSLLAASTLVVIAGTSYGYGETEKYYKQENFKIVSKTNSLKSQKENIDRDMNAFRTKYITMENQINLFSEENLSKLDEEIYSLNLKGSVK